MSRNKCCRDLCQTEIISILNHNEFGHLSFNKCNQSYVVPVRFNFESCGDNFIFKLHIPKCCCGLSNLSNCSNVALEIDQASRCYIDSVTLAGTIHIEECHHTFDNEEGESCWNQSTIDAEKGCCNHEKEHECQCDHERSWICNCYCSPYIRAKIDVCDLCGKRLAL